MVWIVKSHRRIRKWLKKHKEYERAFMEAVTELAKNPFIGEKLRGKCSGFYKWRKGELRLLYFIDKREKTIFIEAVGLRENFYMKYC